MKGGTEAADEALDIDDSCMHSKPVWQSLMTDQAMTRAIELRACVFSVDSMRRGEKSSSNQRIAMQIRSLPTMHQLVP